MNKKHVEYFSVIITDCNLIYGKMKTKEEKVPFGGTNLHLDQV